MKKIPRGRITKRPTERRSYKNRTYSRMAVYPATHQLIRQNAHVSGKTMMDWLDETVRKVTR